MAVVEGCPGRMGLSTPILRLLKCPRCGGDIEMFTTDVKSACEKCGFVAYNDSQSCIQWCQHAKECFGEELYDKLVRFREQE